MQFVDRMHDIRTRFTSESGGNIIIIFALSLTLLGGAVGVAVDYARASKTDQQLQAALDSAVLAAARRKSIDDPDAEKAITDFISANFKNTNPGLNVTVTASVQANGRVRATAKSSVSTTFMRLFGRQKVDIDASSSAQFGASLADIALVLDNTGSMEGPRMVALKDSAKALVDILYATPRADNKIRIGIVPFAQYVNVGTGYRSESWIDVPADDTVCWDTYPNAVNCRLEPTPGQCYRDGIPTSCDPHWECDDYGAPVNVCAPRTWNGCVGSRPYPKDVNILGDFSNRVPGIVGATCPQPLARLDNDDDAIKAKIDAMTVMNWWEYAGKTYIPSGLIWGWRVLAPDGPFGDGPSRVAKPDIKRYMVLMTDGENTLHPNYPNHDNVVEGVTNVIANNLTTETCNSIKAEGTVIFAIAFEVTDPITQAMMEGCASAPPFYYNASDAGRLRTAFEDIANSVIAIRLNK